MVSRALNDLVGGRQQRDVVYVNMLQLLSGAESRDPGLGRNIVLQSQKRQPWQTVTALKHEQTLLR